MLKEEIKRHMMAAIKAHDTVTKEVLRVVVGDLDMAELRAGKPLVQEEVDAIVRKLVKSNEETLKLSEAEAQREELRQELVVLRGLLPQSLDPAAVLEALAPVADAIRAAGNDGQATGVAMKHLKAQGALVESKDVTAAVKQLRA